MEKEKKNNASVVLYLFSHGERSHPSTNNIIQRLKAMPERTGEESRRIRFPITEVSDCIYIYTREAFISGLNTIHTNSL